VSAGYDALLVESSALGQGQSVQAQGIIHGGGKYALRGVRDFAAAAAIREMPERWRACLRGETEPDLSAAQLLSDRCHLWVPRAGWVSRLSAWGLLPVVQKAGLLHARPERLESAEWPRALRGSARAVYAMPEPVVSTGASLAALASRHPGRLLRVPAPEGVRIHSKSPTQSIVTLESMVSHEVLELHPRALLLAAGVGNEGLLERLELRGAPMQRRALLMALLRGGLPPLFGHCVKGGKTAMTITSHPWNRGEALEGGPDLVWQLGGDVAERFADREDGPAFSAEVRSALGEMLPALNTQGVEMAAYRAVRAEARSNEHRRPSGVHARWVSDRVLVCWPTKMALTPLLADEVLAELAQRIGAPEGPGAPLSWPRPEVALDPWREEGLSWHPLD
jgi:hypothetical protein